MRKNMQDIKEAVEKIKKLGRKRRVRFIILYGPAAEGMATKLLDFDLAVGYDGDKRERFDFRVRGLGELSDKFDVQIFQYLPLYIRKVVPRDETLHVTNTRKLNEIVLETIREFELFEPRLLDYINR